MTAGDRELRLAGLLVRLASVLVPRVARREWVEEWKSELWHEARRRRAEPGQSEEIGLIRATRGAFRDAWAARTLMVVPAAARRTRENGVTRAEGIMSDLRVSVRTLMRSAGFTMIAVITLSLGIGATSALFTVVDAVVLEPLAYARAGRLVTVRHPAPGIATGAKWLLSQAGYFHFKENNRTLASLGAYTSSQVNLTEESYDAVRLTAAAVTTSLLEVLSATPALGRMFTESDDDPGAPFVAVLGHEFWQTRYGGDPSVIGRVLRLNGISYEIVGVAREGFQLPTLAVALWLPWKLDPAAPPQNSHYLGAVGRLRDGVTVAEAERDLLALMNRFTELFPGAYSEQFMRESQFSTEVAPLRELVLGDVARVLWILLGAVGLVLLIACVNVANLFMVRSEARRRELAVRSALGAARSRIARLLVTESTLVGVAAGAIGLALAWAAVRVLLALAPADIPRLREIGLDATTVAFTALVAVLSGLAFGVVSILRFRRDPGFEIVKESGRGMTPGRSRNAARQMMVVAQVAMALVLLSGAGLLWRSVERLRAVDPGFDAEGVLIFDLALPAANYADAERAWAFHERLLAAIAALPGVSAVGGNTSTPLDGQISCFGVGFEEARGVTEPPPPCLSTSFTIPGYFEALGIRVEGRTFTMQDFQSRSGAAVVSRSFAERFWPRQNAIGKGIRPFGDGSPYYRVIGVADDVRSDGLHAPPPQQAYFPMLPIAGQPEPIPLARFPSFVVRTVQADALTLLPAVRRAVAEIDAEVPIGSAATMETIVRRSMQRTSFAMVLLAAAAIIALLLGAVGLFGVVSYVVSRRRAEIGIRMALGARTTQVGGQVLWQALRLTALGIMIGIGAATMATPVLGSMLFDVEAGDPVTLTATSLLLLLVAAFASWLPAMRAARIDPVEALRAEG